MGSPVCFILAVHPGITRKCLAWVAAFIFFFGALVCSLLWTHRYSETCRTALAVCIAVTMIGVGLCIICFTAHRWFGKP